MRSLFTDVPITSENTIKWLYEFPVGFLPCRCPVASHTFRPSVGLWAPEISTQLGLHQSCLFELPCNPHRLLASLFILSCSASPYPLFTFSMAFPFTVLKCPPAVHGSLSELLHHVAKTQSVSVFPTLAPSRKSSGHSYLKTSTWPLPLQLMAYTK